MTSNHAICKIFNDKQPCFETYPNKDTNNLLAKPVPILFGLRSHTFMKLYLVTKEVESPDKQLKLNNSHSKVINIHIQIIGKNFLQINELLSHI